ncbi:MAG: sulfotransferase domain-containing protein [Actinomycetota bacterium]|nr:sulfotransferase domain-containing protein [Actinomycetota bacterium]
MSNGRLPNLLVVGVPKAGTGSLFAYLTQHPEICGADKKELGYFNHFNPVRYTGHGPPPIASYKKHFAHCIGQRYALEATPSYSYGGKPVVEGVKKVLKHPKIIITLRDPVDRLWSAYTFQRTLGNIPDIRSYGEYLSVCEQRRRDGTSLDPESHLQGLSIGFYQDYIGVWLDAFGDDLKIVFAEDLFQEPSKVVKELFRWLEIDTESAPAMDLAARNVTKHAHSPRVARAVYLLKRVGDRYRLLPPTVRDVLRRTYLRANTGELSECQDPAVRRHAEEIYRPSNRATAETLAAHGYRDLPAWLQVGPRI